MSLVSPPASVFHLLRLWGVAWELGICIIPSRDRCHFLIEADWCFFPELQTNGQALACNSRLYRLVLVGSNAHAVLEKELGPESQPEASTDVRPGLFNS
jgi:hypothetical protein